MQISGHAPNTKVNHFIQHHHAILKKKNLRSSCHIPSSSFVSTLKLKVWGVNIVRDKEYSFSDAAYDYYNLQNFEFF